MTSIRAFVGHSFTEDDAQVVRAFLDYFDHLARTHPSFSWAHAQVAEPKELAEKVRQLMADKNVFIAICTAKEVVTSERLLRPSFFNRKIRRIEIDNLQAKTSDWIIQEIGLAIGFKLDLILLIEDGVRPPGGLQGNIEYISFSRQAPEKAFVKVAEMISAIAPLKASLSATTESPQSDQRQESAEKTEASLDEVPSSDWKMADYRRAAFLAVVRDDELALSNIVTAFLASPINSDDTAAIEWHARIAYWKCIHGKNGAFGELIALSRAHDRNGNLLNLVAAAYAHFGDYAEAAKRNCLAAELIDNPDKRFNALRTAAINFANAGLQSECNQIVSRLREDSKEGQGGEEALLDALLQISKLSNNDSQVLMVLERLVELNPENSEHRFELAYKHSEMGDEDVALHHYSQIPFSKRTGTTWNNLGAAYENLAMPGKAVTAYRRAEELGETLAMSNLGQKFLEAGFLKEADTEFQKALAVKEHHKNIGAGLTRVLEIPEEEDKTFAEVTRKARPKIDFFKRLGAAAELAPPLTLKSTWQGRSGEITVQLNGNGFSAHGTYTVPASGLAAGLFGAFGSEPSQYEINYEGTVFGRTVVGTVKRNRLGSSTPRTLIGGDERSIKMLIVIAPDGESMEVGEEPHSADPTFYQMQVK